MRLYKDVLLRCKVYNMTTLVDFAVTKLEAYYANRLHSRNATARLVLQSELRRAQYVTSASEITIVADGIFAVPSETDRNIMYVINTSLGVYQCAVGRHGTFCKQTPGCSVEIFHTVWSITASSNVSRQVSDGCTGCGICCYATVVLQ